MSDKKKKGLGRGLSALMSDVNADVAAPDTSGPRAPDQLVPIENIIPNPDQPRRLFETDKLEDLASSIREKGIIQPIIVRSSPDTPGSYQIVAGERRWRAAQLAQLHEIPVLIRDYDDTEVLEVAIIENIQRADLNPVDEALGYQQLMTRHNQTQEDLAKVLGKSRSHVANQVRLLSLPTDVQRLVAEGTLTSGHARALVGHENASALAKQIAAKGLSVRQVENLVKTQSGSKTSPTKAAKPEKDPDTQQIEAELAATLKMKVSIDHTAGQENGKLTLHYRDLGQLDDLLRALGNL